ncbi:MAG TPA: 3'(2'),5'-bisphosphate nucleotidase CysQ [Steroidobacteraceae bacterium]|nr:3'(2'),5'-bisphosphate nucleotidase CysQ [Steroidobacteraceae bacterium]
MSEVRALAEALLPVAARASTTIMTIYERGFTARRKADGSPVTQADLESQRIILDGLARLTPHVPILSEESAQVPWPERRTWRQLWIVDPLDGTREFIEGNGEFTINIALVVDQEPSLGVVAVPAQARLYWGALGLGAFRREADGEVSSLRAAAPARPLRVVASRSHATAQTWSYLDRFQPYELTRLGSSLKFCWLAEGKADFYPRFGPTSEWDTAAGQAVLEGAGGSVTSLDGGRLRYNCRKSLINADFLAFTDPGVLNASAR